MPLEAESTHDECLGIVPGIRNGNVRPLLKKAARPLAASRGRSFDHLSGAYADLGDAARQHKSRNARFESAPFAFGTGKIACILAPHGVRIELVGPAAPPRRKRRAAPPHDFFSSTSARSARAMSATTLCQSPRRG
jgi:hypothetical protein